MVQRTTIGRVARTLVACAGLSALMICTDVARRWLTNAFVRGCEQFLTEQWKKKLLRLKLSVFSDNRHIRWINFVKDKRSKTVTVAVMDDLCGDENVVVVCPSDPSDIRCFRRAAAEWMAERLINDGRQVTAL